MGHHHTAEENIDVFAEKVKSAMESYYGADGEVRVCHVKKNNGILLTGVSVLCEESRVTPTVYLEEFQRRYASGEAFGALMKEILQLAEARDCGVGFDIEAFSDYSQARERIVYKLISTKKNEALLEEIPHIPFLNMSVVFYYLLGNGEASILLYDSHLRHWGVRLEAIYDAAKENTPRLLPPQITDMRQLMCDLLREQVQKKVAMGQIPAQEADQELACLNEQVALLSTDALDALPMYVLTNQEKYYGAACMLYPGVVEDFAKSLGRDVYVLPSSVHEVILLVPDDHIGEEQMEQMVREVNMTQVPPEDVLSDSVYCYAKKEGRFRLVGGAA